MNVAMAMAQRSYSFIQHQHAFREEHVYNKTQSNRAHEVPTFPCGEVHETNTKVKLKVR